MYLNELQQVKDVPKIRVIVRKRPLNSKELKKNDIDTIEIRSGQTVVVKELKNKVDLTKYIEEHHFTFDNSYDENSTNEMIYIETVRPMIEQAFKKAKITCFAYGQTGSGKTYTMMGPPNTNNSSSSATPGLYLLSAYDIFNYLEDDRYNHLEIWVSFYEIYCGKLFDLLNERALLQAREDGKQNICIVGLMEKPVSSLQALMHIIEYGLKVRTTGVTGANLDSSRSHGILQICIKNNGEPHGKITFIDLAGSERAQDTIDTNKQTRIDGAEINKSLLALKECIRALDQEKKHTPFRGSKLTLVLRDSFMGNCRTLMIANISPSSSCNEHTLNTLRYADRVKELRKEKNEPNSDKDPSDILAQMLLMPRQHGKTVKYTVENKKQEASNKTNNNNNMNNNNGSKKPLHINELYQPSKNANNSSNQISKNNLKRDNSPNMNKNYSNYSNNNIIQYNPITNNIVKSNYDQKGSPNYNKYVDMVVKNEDDLQKLSVAHEKLINEILTEEEDFINGHRNHIDDMVDVVKQEMMLINEVDKPGSDIDSYVTSLDKLFQEKAEKIQNIRTRLLKFHRMLKEEEILAKKFTDYQNDIEMNENNNFID